MNAPRVLLRQRDHRRAEIGWACAALIALVALTLALAPYRDELDSGTAALILLTAPLIASAASLRAAVVLSVVSALTFNYVFTRPFDSLAIASSTSVTAFGMYLLLALVVAVTINRLRSEHASSLARAREATLLRDFTIDLVRQNVWLQPPINSALDDLVRHTGAVGASIAIAIEGGEHFHADAGSTTRTRALVDSTMGDKDAAQTPYLAGAPTLVSLRSPDDEVRVFAIATGTESYGVLAIEFTATGSLDGSHERLVGLFANVVAIACERASYQQDAVQRRILEASDQLRVTLLRSVTHDLRTPLTTIRALASAPANLGPLTDDQRSVLTDIERAAARLGHMVDQVLDLSRIEGGMLDLRLETVRLDELVRTAVDAVEPLLPEGASITVQIDPDVPAVPVDEPLIEQVLVNLLDNAIHHGEPPITLTVRTRKGRVEVTVSDHGPGIPEAERRRIFDSGYAMRHNNADARHRGLGLVIGAGFVEAHHGHIRVEPTPGGGSTFVISLPEPTAVG